MKNPQTSQSWSIFVMLVASLGCTCVEHAAPPAIVFPDECPAAAGPVLQGITQMHASTAITCAVVQGKVACWGVDRDGRLGLGTEIKRLDRPIFVSGLEDVVEVDHGVDATFARKKDGSVWVWGPNRMGDFGDGSPDFHIAWAPRHVAEWGNVRKIRGHIPTCAISNDNEVLCAGRPRFRSMHEDQAALGVTATRVPHLRGIVDLAAGGGFTCALNRGGQVHCWGMNDCGQLGNGGGEDTDLPVKVRGLDNAAHIAAGTDTACALLVDGTVRCWGRALGGSQLGERSAKWLHPVAIEGVDRATQIAVSDRVACALMQDGTVRCWGEASYDGQLGDGTDDVRPTQAGPVFCVTDATQITVGDNHSCALLRDGTAKCWGSGPYGAVGDGSAENRKLPVFVLAAAQPAPAADRCPPDTLFKQGPGDDPKVEATAEWCETSQGKRHGLYSSRWATGQTMQKGLYKAGLHHGTWKQYYEHGELLNEALYDEMGEPHGVWIAYSLHHRFAFASCFDHGKRLWQVTTEAELRQRSCP